MASSAITKFPVEELIFFLCPIGPYQLHSCSHTHQSMHMLLCAIGRIFSEKVQRFCSFLSTNHTPQTASSAHSFYDLIMEHNHSQFPLLWQKNSTRTSRFQTVQKRMNSHKYAISIHHPSMAINCPVNPNICDRFSSTEMSKKLSYKLISMQLSPTLNCAYSVFQSTSFPIYLPTAIRGTGTKILFHLWKSFINL